MDLKAKRKFYTSMAWERKRLEVLGLDRWECQAHKARGQYKRATMVHHVLELQERPDLALEIWHEDARQLVSLCDACHEEVHGHRHETREPLTPERW